MKEWLESLGEELWNLLTNQAILIMAGGALGTYLRYVVGKWINSQPWTQGLPYGTLVINVSGSFVLAVAATIILERSPAEYQGWYLLIGTGFCGGYTTFSAFEWETFQLIRDGRYSWALANIAASVVAGFVGVLLGVGLINGIFPRR